MALTTNRYICDWVAECEALLQPEKVLWIDGSEAQLEQLRDAVNGGKGSLKEALDLIATLRPNND